MKARYFLLILGFCMTGTVLNADTTPPLAKQLPKELEIHGDKRVDAWYWLRERENPEVIAYLEAENAWVAAQLAHTDRFQNQLFEEMKGRIKEDDSTAPVRMGDYFYYERFEKGKEYPIYCRKQGSLDAPEEVYLDVNALAGDAEYYQVSGVQVSEDHKRLAYGVDTSGRRIYTVNFKNLETGETLDEVIVDVTANQRWANDNKTLFYTRQDPETLRWDRIYRHTLGDINEDPLVYEESDDTFYTWVDKTRDDSYILLVSGHTLFSEYRYVDANQPESAPVLFQPRERDHEYYIDFGGDRWYVMTNEKDAKNFKLMETPVDKTGQEHWKEVIAHRDDVLIEDFDVFADFVAVQEKYNGLTRIEILDRESADRHLIDFGEPAYAVDLGDNYEYHTKILRYDYESLTTPDSVYDYKIEERERTLVKEDPVLGGFNRDDYKADRVFATAADGTKVPVSLVYRKGMERNGKNPLLQYGYGSYGYSIDATFNSDRLSLLDRGFVFVIAHIRGGSEMGRYWYEDGKLLKKKNTFTDFIAVSEYLIEQGYTSPAHLYATGGSAGGLLMGVVVNMRPDLYNGIYTRVPFVDVITTMLDEDIPLTTGEYDEWGNPNDKEYYDYMLSYSPYDNVEAKDYPNMLVTTGLHDSQVQYWEPAKWVAKLRVHKTDDNRLLLKTNMSAGHGGASGRFQAIKETALNYAFIFDLEGIRE